MRADPRRFIAGGLFLALAVGAPFAACADDAAPTEPAPAVASAPAAAEPSAEPTPEATEPSPSASTPTPTPTPAPAPTEPSPSPTPSPTPDEDEPSPEPTVPPTPAEPSTGVKLTNAQFRWSINALMHKAPFYGKNFLTAGLLADTRGQDMPAGQWKQAEGAVRIERASGSTYQPATWSGFGTGSDHQVVIDGGTGTVDAAAGAARITWRGSFGVARYSGQTGFSVTDPTLIVDNGVGRIEGRLSGFQVSREGNGSGNAGGPIGPTTVVLADLGTVDLSNPAGLSKAPGFYGLQSGHSAQKKDAQDRWGSFPVSFINFVDQVGQAPFWMTSGLDDDLKAGAPVAVSFNAAAPLIVKPPATRETKKPKVNNSTSKAPPVKSSAVPQPVPMAALPRIAPPVTVPPSSVPIAAAFTNTASLTAAAPTVLVDPEGGSSDLGWWIAATFLLMSAAAVAAPSLLVRPRAA